MTILVQNTSITNTFDFWRNRTNELSYAMSNSVVTVNSNTATGNAAITGTFTANNLLLGNSSAPSYLLIGNSTVNAYMNTSSIFLGNNSANIVLTTSSLTLSTNSTSNLYIAIPSYSQYSNGQYYLNANGNWAVIAPSGTGTQTITTTGTGAANLDNFAYSTYNVAEYIVSVKDNNANNYFTGKFILAHDSGTAYITQYATFTSNSTIGTFGASISSGNVYFTFTPTSSNTTVKYFRSIV
jgi:hypothetical protein